MKGRTNWPIVGAAAAASMALALPGTVFAADGASSPSAEVSAAQPAVPVGRLTDFTLHQRLRVVSRTEPTTAEESTRPVPAGRRTDAVLTQPGRVLARGETRAAVAGFGLQPRTATPQRPMDGGR